MIKEIKHSVDIPVIANGGIDEHNFLEVFSKTDADALMLGQRAIGYPKVFADMIALEDEKKVEETTLLSQLKDLKKHLKLIFSFKDERQASDIMRGISVRYIKLFENSSKYRQQLVHAHSLKQYLDIIANIEKSL